MKLSRKDDEMEIEDVRVVTRPGCKHEVGEVYEEGGCFYLCMN